MGSTKGTTSNLNQQLAKDIILKKNSIVKLKNEN
jgi:hypothetical protein